MTAIELRPYQHDMLRAIDGSDEHRVLVQCPTGGGKTVVFAELIRRRGGTALILAHRDELLTQAAAKLRMVAPALAMNIGVVKAGRNDVNAPIVLASVQTLASPRRLAQLPTYYDSVVVDEAHHAVAPSWVRALEHVDSSPLIAGFTATAERHDKKTDLRNVFGELVYAKSLESMIREGYLCDLRAVRVEIDQLDLSKVKKSRGDYQAEALGEALEDAGAIDHAVAAYLKEAEGRKGLAFFPTVATSQHAAAAFNAAGIPAAHVDGKTPDAERYEILGSPDGTPGKLSTGEITMCCNVGVAREGFDEPSLECIILAAPTRSRIAYTQMVGRGTRLYPGKPECLVIDVVGSTEEHSLQSVGVLFGLRRPPKPGETATQAKDRQNADDARLLQRQAPTPHSPMRVEVSSRAVQLFDRDAIAWARVDERWIVRLRNDEMIVLDPHDGAWRVLVFVRDREGPTGMRARIAARNLDLGYAQGAAETIIRNEDSIAFADGTAPWRSQPAPTEQLRTARRLGVTPELGATKGQVADQIAIAVAAERLVNFDRAVREREAATAVPTAEGAS